LFVRKFFCDYVEVKGMSITAGLLTCVSFPTWLSRGIKGNERK